MHIERVLMEIQRKDEKRAVQRRENHVGWLRNITYLNKTLEDLSKLQLFLPLFLL